MNVLKIKDVRKSYTIDNKVKTEVLKGINLELNSGELVAILGESGSGKSTLMNLIGGLDRDYEGEILVGDKKLNTLNERELDAYRKDKIGFIFQSFNLISHLNVIDNVTIAMTLSNVDKETRINRAKDILKEVGLSEQMYKKPNQLSGGQKQRVAIARALVNDPDIILADEPTGALDSKTTDQILDIITNIAKKGKLVIMVTHSGLVAQKCNRVITIDDGVILSNNLNFESEATEYEHNDNKPKQNLSLLSSVKLSLHNMKQKLSRNVLIALGSSIGIISLILMLGISSGIKNYVNHQMTSNVNPLFIEASKTSDTETAPEQKGPQPPFAMAGNKDLTDDEINELKALDGLDTLELGYTKMAFGSSVSFNDKKFSFAQVSPISNSLLADSFVSGSKPTGDEVVISKNLASLMSEDTDSLIGKTIDFTLMDNGNTIKGSAKIGGVYEVSSPIDFLLFNYDTIKNIYADNGIDIEPNVANITVKDTSYVDGTKALLEEKGYNMSMADQMIDMFNEMLSVLTALLIVVSSISLVVSAIMILVVSYISVVERTQEIGVLKAIGARRKDIKRIFRSESFVLGVSSGVLGIVISFLLATLANSVSMDMIGLNMIIISPLDLLIGLLVATIVSVISGVLPAAKAAKLDPIESLRHE